jgi:hypothetical protein
MMKTLTETIQGSMVNESGMLGGGGLRLRCQRPTANYPPKKNITTLQKERGYRKFFLFKA